MLRSLKGKVGNLELLKQSHHYMQYTYYLLSKLNNLTNNLNILHPEHKATNTSRTS